MEIWKTIPIASNYLVSNFGGIQIIDRSLINGGNEFKPKKDDYGYLRVSIRLDELNKGKKHWYVFGLHRLVAFTFIGPRPGNNQVNHIDGIRDNNFTENLEYVNELEHLQHAVSVLGWTPKNCKKYMIMINNTPLPLFAQYIGKPKIEVYKLYRSGFYV